MRKIPMSEMTSVRPELTGFDQHHSPFAQMVSGPRNGMSSKQYPQSVNLSNGEAQRIFTCYEHIFSKKCLEPTVMEEDSYIIGSVDKYDMSVNDYRVFQNPSKIVIFEKRNTREIDYFQLNTHVKGSDGFGYENQFKNKFLLNNANFIEAGTEFSSSPSRDEAFYKSGRNVNVVSMPLSETAEDALLISQSTADLFASVAINTKTFFLSKNLVPLNIYGEEERDLKFMPDIGELVNEDAILAGFRRLSTKTFLGNISYEALARPTRHDTLYSAIPGSEIIDIDLVVSVDEYKKLLDGNSLFTQAYKYVKNDIRFCEEIVKIYDKQKKSSLISDAFNILVYQCMNKLRIYQKKSKNMNTVFKDEAIANYFLKITYKHKREVKPGFKFTGSDGAKGVVSAIREDKYMPFDDYGIRAGMIDTPESGANRLNTSQKVEMFTNRCSKFVCFKVRGLRDKGDYEGAYNEIVEHIESLNLVAEVEALNDAREVDENGEGGPKWIKRLVDHVADKEDLKKHTLSFNQSFTPERLLDVKEKTGMENTPVTFYAKEGEKYVKKRTKKPMQIGDKYMYLLYKFPETIGASMPYINQFCMPVRPGEVRKQLTFKNTPCRNGIDETSADVMAAGTEPVVRLEGMQGSSYIAAQKLGEELFSNPHPTQIDKIDISTEDVIKNNITVKAIQYTFGVVGVDLCGNDIKEGLKDESE